MLPDYMLKAMDERVTREVAGPEGFWKSDPELVYQRVARELLDGGYHPDWIINTLQSLYYAAGEEYGG